MLDLDSLQTRDLRLPTGRSLRYYVSRPDFERLVVMHHGTPGDGAGSMANMEYIGLSECAVVTFDRPGYGASDPEPGRRVADVAPLVGAILDDLGVETAATAGQSGGGPHALATAASLPERISRVAIVAGMGPNADHGFDYFDGQTPLMREEMQAALEGRDASRRFIAREIANGAVYDELFPEPDRRVLERLGPVDRQLRDILRVPQFGDNDAGVDGYVDDMQAFATPWGFDLEAIRCPVRLWWGVLDRFVPRPAAEWLAAQLTNAELEIVEGHGHLLHERFPQIYGWAMS